MNILKYNVNSKRIYLGLTVLLIFVSLMIYFQLNKPSTVAKNDDLPTSASITAEAKGIENGTPLTLLDLENKQKQVIIAGVKTNLKPGKYQVSLASDFAGNKTQEVELKDKEELKIQLQDSSKEVKGIQSATKLNEIGQKVAVFDFTQIKENQAFSQASETPKINKLSIAALPQSNSTNQTTSNSNLQTVAALQPNTENLNSLSQNLILKNQDGLQYIAKDCTFVAVDIVAQTGNVRYFKDCQSNNQDGFFEYDAKNKTENLLLATSDPINQAYVAIHPTNRETIFTRPETGEFGFSDKDGIQIIQKDAFYYAPTFSLDGKSVLVTQKSSKADPKASELRDIFKREIIKFDYQDLKQNKDKAKKTVIGETYFVPRAFEPNYRFYQWQDNATFKAGDSDALFSLDKGQVETFKSNQPGKFYTDNNGKIWRVYQFTLFDDQNNRVTDKVTNVYQTPDKQTWFAIDGYLSRIVDNQVVLAYPRSIAAASAQTDGLTLLLTDGNQVKLSK
jgi:hypothetical protein